MKAICYILNLIGFFMFYIVILIVIIIDIFRYEKPKTGINIRDNNANYPPGNGSDPQTG